MEEAENAMILLYDLCRLCLDEPGVTNIFKPIDWTHDILTFTGVQVNISDEFPQTICSSCRDIISCVKILKDIATENNKRLWNIQGGDDNQVLRTESHSHLVIITPCTACDNQNESNETNEVSNGWNESFKSKIVFESDDEVIRESNSQTEKQSGQRNLSKSDNLHASSTKKSKESLTSSTSCTEDPNKTSTKKSKQSPNSTSDNNPEKVYRKNNDEIENRCETSKKKKKQPPTSTSIDSPEKVVMFCRKYKKVDEIEHRCETSSKKIKQSPTSTSDNNPKKIVMFGKIKIKVDEFDYKCETCNRTYATPKKLYLHQLSHNKKFVCPLDACCKKFATKGDLQKHIRSHTGEKPYKCDLCDQSFTQNVTLKSHKEKKHTESQSKNETN